MSWISQFVEHNRDFAGNALKNVSPFAFLIPGVGPLAAAGLGAAGSALGRGIQHGANIGQIAKQGVQGGAEAYSGAQAMGALRGAFAPSSAASTSQGLAGPGSSANQLNQLSQAGAPSGWSGGAGSGGLQSLHPALSADQLSQGAKVASDYASGNLPAETGGSSWLHNAADGTGNFLKSPSGVMAVGQGLQGLGNMSRAHSENRLVSAQADQLNYYNQLQRQRDIALEPLRRALAGKIGLGLGNAPNPFATTG